MGEGILLTVDGGNKGGWEAKTTWKKGEKILIKWRSKDPAGPKGGDTGIFLAGHIKTDYASAGRG